MHDAEPHEMELLGVDETGSEEWYCPSCGRRFLMRWPPNYGRTILVAGDEHVAHVGGKGGLRMGAPSIREAPTSPLEPAEDEPLSEEVAALWRRLLAQIEADDTDSGEHA